MGRRTQQFIFPKSYFLIEPIEPVCQVLQFSSASTLVMGQSTISPIGCFSYHNLASAPMTIVLTGLGPLKVSNDLFSWIMRFHAP
eukprot:g64938.t1